MMGFRLLLLSVSIANVIFSIIYVTLSIHSKKNVGISLYNSLGWTAALCYHSVLLFN